MREIIDGIFYIEGGTNPLSAEAVVLSKDDECFLFDVGNGERVLSEIMALPGAKRIAISHFHPDHMGNLSKLTSEEVFAGKNTGGYIKNVMDHKKLILLEEGESYVTDFCGRKVELLALPAAHARGSLIMSVDERYVFMGDSLYSTHKKEQAVYNVGILKKEMELLENVRAEYFYPSHSLPSRYTREEMLMRLQKIYDRRMKNEAYILAEATDWR